MTVRLSGSFSRSRRTPDFRNGRRPTRSLSTLVFVVSMRGTLREKPEENAHAEISRDVSASLEMTKGEVDMTKGCAQSGIEISPAREYWRSSIIETPVRESFIRSTSTL